MRVVIDTNVVVSGYLSPLGNPARVIDCLLSGTITALVDDRIMAEYREVLLRPRFQIPADAVEALLDYLDSEAEQVVARPLKLQLPDPDDLPFLEVAIAGSAEALITGNLKHFPRSAIGRRLIVYNPAEFLKALPRDA